MEYVQAEAQIIILFLGIEELRHRIWLAIGIDSRFQIQKFFY